MVKSAQGNSSLLGRVCMALLQANPGHCIREIVDGSAARAARAAFSVVCRSETRSVRACGGAVGLVASRARTVAPAVIRQGACVAVVGIVLVLVVLAARMRVRPAGGR